ncbi:hypothetical protein G9C98_000150 [Cotesia typhae]|uniref:TATA element modulatory factor 1 TATA binding domain-containing protein n=1 Tax=Cotesia typhae TaxID=2053667 RepID=A0A8J5RL31_9HYME|nr:hypothetical protein G9C98_000150 [Cotesia typhae]
MSWFDASGFANLAKSALKEAQKTIDKALDIKEEDQQQQKVPESPVIDDSNFFAAWGIKNESSVQQTSSLKQDSSIWGSFTGSFFEPPKTNDNSKSSRSLREVSDQSLDTCLVTSSVSLPDKLASVQNKARSSSQSIDLDAESTEDDTDKTTHKKDSKDFSTSDSTSKTDSEIESPKSTGEKQVYSRHLANRVSLLSSESDKKSSESVEILGSRSATNTDCTTTPDSEIVSTSDSPSPSRSTLDLQRNSESVEILPDSLVTSPSSVEVLEDPSKAESPFLSPMGYNKSPDAATTSFEPESESLQYSSSDISPYASPMEESKSLRLEDTEELTPISQLQSFPVGFLEKSSSVALENCQTIDESDEISQAEDSYTSASESTLMTIMETFHQQLDQTKRLHDSSESAKSTCITSASSQLESSLDSLKDIKQSLHLPLEPITTQPIRKVESLAEKMDIDLVKSATIEPLSSDADKLKSQLLQEFGAPDQLGLTDSSCEGTLVDTSSDENSMIKTNKEVNSEEEGSLTSSSYVKNMLADAMVEKHEILADLERHDISHREHSPISSESPANLHSCKSGDLLTKTLKTRGHSRELSEISIGSDDGINEIDKLRKRIQELVEILEVRESKLIDVSRMNMDLHEQNNHLKLQVDNWEKRAQQNQDVNLIADEYTQRMSVLEKKFQQTIRERDLLKDQVESLKKELSDQSSSLNAEKDEIIKQLREEGEKLSKQQLQHSNIIKKLRAKEKETEATLKSQKEQLEEQSSELDRLKRSLNAKEEVERSQIEAVHTLTAKVKKQEKEILSLQEKLDNTTHKMNAYKMSLDAAKVELAETKLNFNAAEEELKQIFESAGESCRLSAQVQDLKVKLRQEEESHVKKIEGLKQENNDLLKRLEAAEARSEELSESVSIATKPLLRQLEQLQANLTYKSNSFMKQEKILSDTIDELQTKLDNMVAADRSHVEENINFKSRIALLESQIKRSEAEKLKVEELCEQSKLENSKLVGEIEKLMLKIKNIEKSHGEEVKEFKREIESLKDKLSMEKAVSDAEKRKTSNVLEHQQSTGEESRVSPTSSVRRDSISSTNSVWLAFNDSIFDTSSGRFPNVYDGLRISTNTTSTIETLQAQLKAREGEIQTLQWEMSRKNNERDALNMELSNLSMKVEELSAKLVQVEALNANLSEIQTRYDALLQMYGEKVEETQELQLDLEDVKEMYKSQIDQLLRKES